MMENLLVVWYFSRKLCKAFVFIRKLKTTEIIISIGKGSMIHKLAFLFKCYVRRKLLLWMQ